MKVSDEPWHPVGVTVVRVGAEGFIGICPVLSHVVVSGVALFRRKPFHAKEVIHEAEIFLPLCLFLVDVTLSQLVRYLVLVHALLFQRSRQLVHSTLITLCPFQIVVFVKRVIGIVYSVK